MKDKVFNMHWGNAVAPRQAFLETTSGRPIIFGLKDLENFNYPEHEGDKTLIELTRNVIKRQVGTNYKHVILTNGATGALTLTLRAYAQRGYNVAIIRQPPYFPIYPSIINSAGMKLKEEGSNRDVSDKPVTVIDSPSNPQGLVVGPTSDFGMPTIWDAVYHNNVYMPVKTAPIKHDVLIGSYSKLTGLNGIRVGWIATNDDLLYVCLQDLVTAEYSGLSTADAQLLLQLVSQFKDDTWWDLFENNARYALNYNREEWSKLEKFFCDWPVHEVGMFHYGYMDNACKKLFAKSGVVWTPGSLLGANDFYGRFNLGQDCKVVKAAVREVLKNDKI